MAKAVILDMDGTIADFYSVRGWLDCLMNEDATPYAEAMPLGDCVAINNALRVLQSMGYIIEVVSWLAKGQPSKSFNNEVRKAKLEWLERYYPCIDKRNVHIVAHGTSKWHVSRCKGGVLFDDESRNVHNWKLNTNAGSAILIRNRYTLLDGLIDLIERG